jgi:hypothetical protein
MCISVLRRPALFPVLLATLVAGCGGDAGEACSATPGVYPVTYEPGTSNGAGYSQLFYVRGSEQTWNLAFHGTTPACSSGLAVRAQTPLPTGYTVDANTGAIHRDKSATGQSGYCTEAGQVTTLWDEGVCPAGQVPVVNGYLIEITNANDPPYTLGVSFAPAPQ